MRVIYVFLTLLVSIVSERYNIAFNFPDDCMNLPLYGYDLNRIECISHQETSRCMFAASKTVFIDSSNGTLIKILNTNEIIICSDFSFDFQEQIIYITFPANAPQQKPVVEIHMYQVFNITKSRYNYDGVALSRELYLPNFFSRELSVARRATPYSLIFDRVEKICIARSTQIDCGIPRDDNLQAISFKTDNFYSEITIDRNSISVKNRCKFAKITEEIVLILRQKNNEDNGEINFMRSHLIGYFADFDTNEKMNIFYLDKNILTLNVFYSTRIFFIVIHFDDEIIHLYSDGYYSYPTIRKQKNSKFTDKGGYTYEFDTKNSKYAIAKYIEFNSLPDLNRRPDYFLQLVMEFDFVDSKIRYREDVLFEGFRERPAKPINQKVDFISSKYDTLYDLAIVLMSFAIIGDLYLCFILVMICLKEVTKYDMSKY